MNKAAGPPLENVLTPESSELVESAIAHKFCKGLKFAQDLLKETVKKAAKADERFGEDKFD